MVAVGMFGKVPSFGDFVSVNTGTPTYREFERWLEDSNDVMAEQGVQLPEHPLGFIIRCSSRSSILVGILIGSRDSVGRVFPLGLFYEIAEDGMSIAALPQAMRAGIARLNDIALKAPAHSYEEFRELVRELPLPVDHELAVHCNAQLHRLQMINAKVMLERLYGEGDAPYYGSEVILRACEVAANRPTGSPLVLESQVGTDVELMFSAMSIVAMSGDQQPGAVFWDVRSQRALFALGSPDRHLLALIAGKYESDRLWPMWTDRKDVAARARQQLPPTYRDLLASSDDKISAKEFLDSMAIACKPRSDQSAVSTDKQRQGKWQSRVL